MKIMLATDGSDYARHAENMLARLPLPSPVELKIVTVCASADLHELHGIPEGIHGLVDECRQKSREILEQSAARCREAFPQLSCDLLDGHPAEEVILAARQWGADLIAIGARGLGAVSRFFLGSTSDRIAQHAPCAVLVVRPGEDSSAPLERFMLAYDGSPAADAAAERLLSLPLTAAQSVYIRSVIETAPWGSTSSVATQVYAYLESQLKPKLDQLVHRFSEQGVNASASLQVAHQVADDLIEVATRQQADLLVMGSVGKSAWQRLLLGSVTLRVLHHAPCSVWIEHWKK